MSEAAGPAPGEKQATVSDQRGWWRVELNVKADKPPPLDPAMLLNWLSTEESAVFDEIKLFSPGD